MAGCAFSGYARWFDCIADLGRPKRRAAFRLAPFPHHFPVWSYEEIAALADAAQPKAGPRGPYKTKKKLVP